MGGPKLSVAREVALSTKVPNFGIEITVMMLEAASALRVRALWQPGYWGGGWTQRLVRLPWEPEALLVACEHSVCMCGLCVAASPYLEASKLCICFGGPHSLSRQALGFAGSAQGGVCDYAWGKQFCRHIHARSIGQRDRIFCCLINFVKRWS